MRWKGRRQSSNVEDRRSSGGGGPALGGAGLVIVLLISFIFGGPQAVIKNLGYIATQENPQVEYVETAEDKELSEFLKVVFADTEDVWEEIFREMGREYQEPKMVIYNDYVKSACGSTSSAVGPFYCPGDHSVYIDLSFYNDLSNKLQAPGDFAMAYVISHEVGHHIQTLLGVTDQMQEIRQRVSEKEYNAYSVRFELQADYLAGVWANRIGKKGYIEMGDLEEAIRAAEAVGDDRIQRQAQGYVVPDSFTHGSSEQRSYWFYRGYETGDLSNWDTFNDDGKY